MELDDFKKILDEEKDSDRNEFLNIGMKKYDTKKSNHPILRIRKKLVIEIVINLLLLILLVSVRSITLRYMSPYIYWPLILIALAYVIFGLVTLNRLKSKLIFESNTREFIEEFLLQIKKYINILIKSVWFILPPAGTIGFISGVQFVVKEKLFDVLTETRVLIFLCLLLLFLTLGGYYANRWVYRKFYGRQIAELEEMLNEMND